MCSHTTYLALACLSAMYSTVVGSKNPRQNVIQAPSTVHASRVAGNLPCTVVEVLHWLPVEARPVW